MGGLTGLPRIPPAALALTRRWNKEGAYTEATATLWRDLETLYGSEDVAGLGGSRTYKDSGRMVDSGIKTNKFRGYTRDVDLREATVLRAVRRHPTLLNPAVSNRFTFARSKAILTSKLSSQRAAIDAMVQDPSLLWEGDALEEMSSGQIRTRALTQQAATSAGPVLLLVAPLLAAAANGYDVTGALETLLREGPAGVLG